MKELFLKLLKYYHKYGRKTTYVAKTPDGVVRICCIHYRKGIIMVEDTETGRICLEYELTNSGIICDKYCFNTIEIIGKIENLNKKEKINMYLNDIVMEKYGDEIAEETTLYLYESGAYYETTDDNELDELYEEVFYSIFEKYLEREQKRIKGEN